MTRHITGTTPGWLALCLILLADAPSTAEEALQFVLPDLNGGEFSLDKELGKGPLVLDFWATWCKPCIKELPKLQEISGRLYMESMDNLETIDMGSLTTISSSLYLYNNYSLETLDLSLSTDASERSISEVLPRLAPRMR